MKKSIDKKELFSSVPVPEALLTMAIPTIISQMINLIYNMVDAFFIGRTGNSYMMAATSITLTIVMLNIAMSNLFGIGGGSLVARLMGREQPEKARQASAFSLYGAALIAVTYSLLIGLFLNSILRLLGASDATIGFARSYTIIVTVIGTLPTVLSLAVAHLLRNTGYSGKASLGLSMGGILNCMLDPLFMFVILPKGQEVTGAAIATLISNCISCMYLLNEYRKAQREAPLSMRLSDAKDLDPANRKMIFMVGIPSALLNALFDVANISVNILAAAHSDLVLAAMGIVMKVERIPNAVNIGICQGMLPIVAFNYASGNHERMKETMRTARNAGLIVSVLCIIMFTLFAPQLAGIFLNTSTGDTVSSMQTIAYASSFLHIRCFASPVQLLNYHTSFSMQAMGKGKETLLHAVVRELVLYIPLMIVLDRMFGELGLAAALPVGEGLGAVFALMLLKHTLKHEKPQQGIS
ncbi:MAG: hypothetical protein IKE28_01545 [Solobacterium sp.]|nr:hypothetical protein [Solobacterium sp.]